MLVVSILTYGRCKLDSGPQQWWQLIEERQPFVCTSEDYTGLCGTGSCIHRGVLRNGCLVCWGPKTLDDLMAQAMSSVWLMRIIRSLGQNICMVPREGKKLDSLVKP